MPQRRVIHQCACEYAQADQNSESYTNMCNYAVATLVLVHDLLRSIGDCPMRCGYYYVTGTLLRRTPKIKSFYTI